MRPIRCFRRTANFGLFLRFQRFGDTKILSARLHPVLNDKSNVVNGSNILGCDRSYSASAVSKVPEDKKPRQRVSKNERKSMVEAYVNEYRLANEGKYPCASETRKKVGGSYYFVRQILQKVIYNSKQSSTDSKYTSLEKSAMEDNEMACDSNKPTEIEDNCLEKSTMKEVEIPFKFEEVPQTTDLAEDAIPVKEDEIPFKFEEVPQTRDLGENARPIQEVPQTKDLGEDARPIQEDEMPLKFEEVPQTKDLGEDAGPILKDIENSSSMIFPPKNDKQVSVSVETDEPKDVGAQSHRPIDKPESSQDLDYKRERELLEEKVKSDASEHKAGPLKSTEVSGRKLEEVPPKYAEPENKSSVWNNLKSFANDILSIWKKRS